METVLMLTVSEQIKKALDGRTKRWLAVKAGIPETDLVRKMSPKYKDEFSDEDIRKINEVLKVKIKK